jgi:hypothetical protein
MITTLRHRWDNGGGGGRLPVVDVVLGYYTRGDSVFAMLDEPPLGQYVLRDGAWVPLPDGFYLMDKIIDGDVDTDGPFADPPEGVPTVRLPVTVR